MILNVKNLHLSYPSESRRTRKRVDVLKGINLELRQSECLGIVGESGSGKSSLARVITRLRKPCSGLVEIEGRQIYPNRELRGTAEHLNCEIGIVFQNYKESVSPRLRVKDIIGESLRILRVQRKQTFDRKKMTIELLEQVGLDSSFLNRYPHEMSGGELQRVCIARSLALKPKILVLDEAVSSLDAVTQTQILKLLMKLKSEYNLSYIFITHDLMTLSYICDRVLFMYKGQFVEDCPVDELSELTHPYARKLLDSILIEGLTD